MNDFEETKDLTAEQLHAALETGDAHERVLAIWALGLRSAGAVMMADQLRSEPDSGVRRALAVVLAGQGETDLLVAMCRHDPSVHVRASAVQMVMRFAAAGRVPWSIVEGRLSDAPEVRASIVSQIDIASPLHAAACAALRDDEELVRREAFETCVKLSRAGACAREILCDALERARPGERANALSMWFQVERAEVIAPLLAGASSTVREQAIRLRPALAAQLTGDDAELYLRLEHGLRGALADASLFLLVALAQRHPGDTHTLKVLVARLKQLDSVPAERRPELHALAASVETVRFDDDEDDVEELALYEIDWAREREEAAAQYSALRSEFLAQLGRLGG